MNSNITFGIIVFLAWSTFCSWHYACNIKGLCFGVEPSMEQTIEPIISTNKAQTDLVASKSDTDTIVALVIKGTPPINIIESNIRFLINSNKFSNPEYVDKFIADLKTNVENRKIKIKIEGFTCDLGNEQINQKLGLERATVMKSLLVQNNFSSSNIELVSHGEIPSNENTNEERLSNRKVIVTIKSIDQ
jgi:outer membrane protein OmpA-like peptidoglycan-associated protein